MFSITPFQTLLKALPRATFDRFVQQHAADNATKGFGCWQHLLAMVYGQLSQASSLRVLQAGFNSQDQHHYHLNAVPVRRSTLADANARRNPEVFVDVARWLMTYCSRTLRSEGKELLYLLDSTSLTLKGPGFDDWTGESATRNTQGLKVHVLLDAQTRAPLSHSITAPNVNDRDEGVKLAIQPGATYVFDKGYCDYNWWHRLDEQHAYFVTRFKRNAALQIVRELPIPAADAPLILADELVRFSHLSPRGGKQNHYRQPLRRVTVARPDHETPLVLATNDLSRSAKEIAEQYKARWGIELFFKWIKQHLRIKQFYGRSENAVKIQVLTALIAYLLLVIEHHRLETKHSLWHWLAQVRATLFERPSRTAAQRRKREHQREVDARQAILFR